MPIEYKTSITPSTEQIIELYEDAGLPRPTKDSDRIHRMYEGSNVIVTAWDKDKLVGIARSITDHCWCCYLADLAVSSNYQQHGIGKKLISTTRELLGEEVMLLLLSVPTAMDYYEKIGMQKVENGFIFHRTK